MVSHAERIDPEVVVRYANYHGTTKILCGYSVMPSFRFMGKGSWYTTTGRNRTECVYSYMPTFYHLKYRGAVWWTITDCEAPPLKRSMSSPSVVSLDKTDIVIQDFIYQGKCIMCLEAVEETNRDVVDVVDQDDHDDSWYDDNDPRPVTGGHSDQGVVGTSKEYECVIII